MDAEGFPLALQRRIARDDDDRTIYYPSPRVQATPGSDVFFVEVLSEGPVDGSSLLGSLAVPGSESAFVKPSG